MFQINIDSLLLMRDLVEKASKHLALLVEEDFRVVDALLDHQGDIRVLVEAPRGKRMGDSLKPFCVVLHSADLYELVGRGSEFVEHLTMRFVQCLPEPIRAQCSPAIDPWLSKVGLSEQGGNAPMVPPVPSAVKEGGAA